LNTKELKHGLTPESIPQDWTRHIEECASNMSITLVCGAPFSGKSVFSRRLLNRYLTGHGKLAPALPSVYFLDIDSDQPEYNPHGQITLTLVREINLGPPFTHPTTIPTSPSLNETIRSHPIPMQDTPNFIDHVISCVKDLFETYRKFQQRNPIVPLIINTPGWIYASHFDVLLRILSQTTPQRLVHIRDLDSIDEERAHKFHGLNVTASKHRIAVQEVSTQWPILISSRTHTELRHMHMLSYFHCTSKPDIMKHVYDSKPLSHSRPWEFCYEENKAFHQDFIGFLSLSEWVEPQHLFTALNGSIIQVVETMDEDIQGLFGQLPRTIKYHIPYFEKGPDDAVKPLDPATSKLVCTALLRGWIPERRIAQLLVPKSHEALIYGLKPERTVFVFGCCDTPEWAFTEDAYNVAAERTEREDPGAQLAIKPTKPQPWVACAEEIGNMGYLNTVRRIRKFQQ